MPIPSDVTKFDAALCAAALLFLTASMPATAAQEPRPAGEHRAVPPRPGDRHTVPQRPPSNRWLDNAHGHARYYPRSGFRVHALPGHPPPIVWRGSNYWFWSGVWYGPGPGGYVVVRPPYGVVVADLPPFRTIVTIGGITYLYLNGVYYRERAEGGYEVVPTPVAALGTTGGAPGRLYVYPAQAQTAEQQASDEYECHSWAVQQSGFDPAPAATGQGADTARRGDYVRAQTACLEGRGYTVR
jgi:hypothetical protein